jgi:peptidoglycan/LPS O-acetylase OafA/YrhL
VRGLAALAVVVFHSNTSWLPFGWAAVDLFFVLSGFLITSIIVRHGGTAGFLRSFYIRRGLRTWPIYYLLIAVIAISNPLLKHSCVWSRLPFVLTYTQTFGRFWPATAEPFNVSLLHTWSLAIEEQFYLFWPALVLLAGRRPLPLLALVCASGAVLARSRGIWWDIFTRCDGLALGALLAWCRLEATPAVNRGWAARGFLGAVRPAALAAVCVLGALGLRFGLAPHEALEVYPGTTILAFNLVWLGVIELVLTHAGGTATALLRLRPLQRLGQISYGLYLYHFPILGLFLAVARDLGVRGKAYEVKFLSIVVAITVAAISWRYFERPLLALKRKHAYARAEPGHDLIRADAAEGSRPVGLLGRDSARNLSAENSVLNPDS